MSTAVVGRAGRAGYIPPALALSAVSRFRRIKEATGGAYLAAFSASARLTAPLSCDAKPCSRRLPLACSSATPVGVIQAPVGTSFCAWAGGSPEATISRKRFPDLGDATASLNSTA